jgi:hypothetical protein
VNYFMGDFSGNAEFARRGKALSRQHKAKISRALKGRGNGKRKPTLGGHVLKGAKLVGALGGGLGALQGGLVGGALAGPPGAITGAAYGGLSGAVGGGISGAGYGAAVYGGRRLVARGFRRKDGKR